MGYSGMCYVVRAYGNVGVLEFLLDNVIVLGDKCYCLANSVIQLVNCCDLAGRSLL